MDIVDDFLRRMRAAAADTLQIPPDSITPLAERLELEMRQQWGGSQGEYVAKRPTRIHAIRIGQALRQSQPMPEVFASAGVKPWNGYRVLRKK